LKLKTIKRISLIPMLLFSICLLEVGATGSHTANPQSGDVPDLPHRSSRIEIDGNLNDWHGPALVIAFADSLVPPPLNNSGRFRLSWDADHLWFAAEIEDNEVYPPPDLAEGATIYQWDSIEIYIDGHGNRSPRMDENDTQLIISCNGRHGTMQGDELLRSVEEWEIPKRERLGLAVRAAARRTATGYIVEGAFPFTAVDIAEARAGQVIAIDVGWNDWIEDHPRLPELLKDLENLVQLTHHESEGDVEIVDPDSIGWDGLLDWEARAYRPDSWRSGSDFGRPPKWQLLQLAGRPPLAETIIARWGLMPLITVMLAAMIVLALTADLWQRRRYQKKVRELLIRIDELSQPAKPETTSSEPPDWKARVADRLTGAPDRPLVHDTISQVLSHINDNLGKSLSVGNLANGIGVSPRTLQRTCQDELGAPPRDVILAVKMRVARAELSSGNWRVGEVASRVGFDSPYHFSRRFKDFYGTSPSAVIPSREPVR
jgi:AraC-like DNA-binding protein